VKTESFTQPKELALKGPISLQKVRPSLLINSVEFLLICKLLQAFSTFLLI